MMVMVVMMVLLVVVMVLLCECAGQRGRRHSEIRSEGLAVYRPLGG
jgi:hypothetical protein